VYLETAAYGDGVEDEEDRPFWADDPPPPPRKQFFKFVDPHAIDVPGEPEELPIGNKIIASVWFKAFIALIVVCSVLSFAIYKYVNRPLPVVLSANPASMVGNWVTDDGTLTVELHLDQNGTGRIAWHVHGYMPPGISSLGDATFHWAQNAQQKIVFKEDTPFDSHTIYPAGMIQNLAEHNSPTWSVDHLNDALVFSWSTPQSSSVVFTGAQD
jgi:hypothetical protein